MVKRKTDSSSSNNGEDRSKNISNNSINQSYIETANLMSKTKLFNKGLNQSTVIPNIKVEQTSEISENEDVSPKPKKKSKAKNKHKETTSVSDNEMEATIASLVNETREKVLKNKSKKSPKRASQDNTFSEKVLENIKREIEEKDSNEAQNVDLHQENGNDEVVVASVEKKIHLIQDIRILPEEVQTPQEYLDNLYPNSRKIDVQTKMKIKDSIDVYLLHVPKNVNPKILSNLEINLEENCRVNLNGESYTIKATSKVPDPTLVLNNKTEVIHFKKNLVLQKYIKANKEPTIPLKEKFLVPLPTCFKKRHPLFGSNYEDRIKLDETIQEKVDDALKNLLKPSKSKKTKKVEKTSFSSTLLPDVSPTDFNLNLSSISSEKKSKMSRRKSIAQANDDISFITDLFKTEVHKKQKISKKEVHGNEVDSETKKRKFKEEPEDSSQKKKKKKE